MSASLGKRGPNQRKAELDIEGLAAQLYVRERMATASSYPWWHLLREDIKRAYRKAAKQRIAEFEALNPPGRGGS